MMSPELEARATALEAKLERCEIAWAGVLEENARLRAECQRLREVVAVLMDGDGGRTG